MSRAVLACGLMMLALTMAFPAAAAPLPSEVKTVAGQFVPAVVTVPSGGRVTFTSIELSLHHQPTADDNTWTGHLMPGLTWPDPSQATFSVAITKPAGSVVTYRCTIHPVTMHAVIVVV